MSKIGQSIIEGLELAIKHAKGNKVKLREHKINVLDIDIKSIRAELNMSQAKFANSFGFSVSSVRNWEQGRRVPEKSAILLLQMAKNHPTELLDLIKKVS